MKFKQKLYVRMASLIHRANIHRFYSFKKDSRKTTSFKLVFFSGAKGISYLNASLISIYKVWTELPEIIIISDGTPQNTIMKKLVSWPKGVEILTWQECANYFKNSDNGFLFNYADKEIWGKKFVGINYCALNFPILYSDTDILWFKSPQIFIEPKKIALKMSEDITHCYSSKMLEKLNLENLNDAEPLNAGLILANGDFSTFPGWSMLCNYVSEYPDFRTEQTSFAILNNYFSPNQFFNLNEVLIKIDDEYSLNFTRKHYPKVFARHYVDKKFTTFWRDFVFILFSGKNIK